MSESGGWGSNAFVREHGGSVPYVVRCVASNMDQRQGRQLRDLLVARAPGDVYVAYGDPVQWVIGRNLHRRHLTAVRRVSCVSAAIDWAKQGHQKRFDRDENTGQFTIPAESAGMGDTAPQTDAGQTGQESFFTQDERGKMSDASTRTVRMSDRYEKAGLGPEIRSGAISGAEAARKVRDPNAPKPPSQAQRLKMKLEAKTLEYETELASNEALRWELREAKAQVSEYPHEREAVASEREVVIAALTSSVAELQAKLNDEKRRASWFEKQARALGWYPAEGKIGS